MSRHVTIAAALAVAGVFAGTVFLVRPADRRTRATYQEVAELTPLIATAPVHNARLHDLGYALDELGGQVRNICRTDSVDGEGEDFADALFRAISARGARVQCVRTGSPRVTDDEPEGRILPFTIELEGTFDGVFEALRRVEAMPHPVEITSVAMDVIDEETRDRSPTLAATIDLDVFHVRAALEVGR